MPSSTRAPVQRDPFARKRIAPGPSLASFVWLSSLAMLCAACATTPDPACLRACDAEWQGCYTTCDKRVQACQDTCRGGAGCDAHCRQAYPLWKDRCDEMNDRCTAKCNAASS